MAKTKKSQRDIVLSWLKKHGEITTRQAVTELNIMSLPKRIEELRKSGVPIRTTYRTSANGARYGVYSLVKKTKKEIICDFADSGFTKEAKEKALKELEYAGLRNDSIYCDVLNVLAW